MKLWKSMAARGRWWSPMVIHLIALVRSSKQRIWCVLNSREVGANKNQGLWPSLRGPHLTTIAEAMAGAVVVAAVQKATNTKSPAQLMSTSLTVTWHCTPLVTVKTGAEARPGK